MSITDFNNPLSEVRIKHGSQFQQIPNMVEAGEEFEDGVFVLLDSDGNFIVANQLTAATHCVLRSGAQRLTADEIATLTGSVQQGEPTMAVTGQGVISIPIADSVKRGDELTLNYYGYAVKRNIAEDAYIIGTALEDVNGSANDPAMADAMITLPATYSAA